MGVGTFDLAFGIHLGDADSRLVIGCSEPLVLLLCDLVGLTPVGDVMETVYGADDPAVLVFDRLDMDHHPYRRPIRPLYSGFGSSYGNAGTEHRGHRGFATRD